MSWFPGGSSGSTTTTRPPSGGSSGTSTRGSWFPGDSGGGSSGSSGGSSSGGSSAPKKVYNKRGIGKPATGAAFDVEGNLIRQASKLAALGTQHPHQQDTINRYLKENLQGYSLGQINQMAAKAGIPEGVTQVLRRNLPDPNKGEPAFQTVLDLVGRPGQAVQGGFSEAGPGQVFSPEGAIKGLTGKEQYTPIQTVARSLGGQSRLQARKTEAGLNPVARVAGNIGGGIALDPLTYVSFGTTAGSKAAIDSAAEIVAAERVAKAAETGGEVLSKADTVATLRDAIARMGAKRALTKQEYAALGKGVKRGLRGAQGGVKVVGKTVVPGKAFSPISGPLGSVADKLIGSRAGQAVEDVTRTLPGVRQAERAGEVTSGTVEDVAAALRRAQGSTSVSNEDWLRLSKAGAKVSEESRPTIIRALENPELVPTLTKEERKAFDVLDQIRHEKTAVAVESGRLRSAGAQFADRQVAEQAPDIERQARQQIQDWAVQAAQGDPQAAARLSQPADKIYEDALVAARGGGGTTPVTPGLSPTDQFAGAARQMQTENYYPRVLSDEARAQGQRVETNAPVSLSASRPGFSRSREEATRFADTTQMQHFEQDPFVAMYKHSAAVNADAARTRFIEDMRGIQGTDGNPIIQTAKELHPKVQVAVEEAKVGATINGRIVKEVPVRTVDEAGQATLRSERVLVDPILAHDPAFDRVMKIFADPARSQDLKNFYDKAMQLWKGYATTFGPFSGGFGLRNFLGNQINGFFLTGTNPLWQTKAFNLIGKLNKGIKDGDVWKYLSDAEQSRLREAFESGVLGHGFYTEETGARNLIDHLRNQGSQSVGRKVASGFNPVNLDNYALRLGRRFNSRIEDTARLGLFMAKREGGYTTNTASRLVQKYLFDYGDLSQADQAIKHVIPFWTWTRKNLPLQLEVLAKTPGAASAQAHILDALRTLTPNVDQAAIPKWAKEANAVPFGSGSAYVPDLPITSIDTQLKPLFDLWNMRKSGPKDAKGFFRDLVLAAQPGGPFAAAPQVFTQQALGQDLFSGKKYKPGDTIGGVPAQIESPLEQLAPFGPGIAKLRGILNSKTQTRKLISGLSGVQTTAIDKSTRTNEQYRRLDELNNLIAWLKQQGVNLPTLKYIPTKDRKVP